MKCGDTDVEMYAGYRDLPHRI